MSTRSGKRIHSSPQDDNNGEHKTSRNGIKTRSKHLSKDSADKQLTEKKLKKHYVKYPTEELIDESDSNSKSNQTLRKSRRNTLKERNVNDTSAEKSELGHSQKTTRRTKRCEGPDYNITLHAAEDADEKKNKKKSKKKKMALVVNENKLHIIHNEIIPSKKKSNKKKYKKKSGSFIVEEVMEHPKVLNTSEASVDSFHSAAGSPKYAENCEEHNTIVKKSTPKQTNYSTERQLSPSVNNSSTKNKLINHTVNQNVSCKHQNDYGSSDDQPETLRLRKRKSSSSIANAAIENNESTEDCTTKQLKSIRKKKRKVLKSFFEENDLISNSCKQKLKVSKNTFKWDDAAYTKFDKKSKADSSFDKIVKAITTFDNKNKTNTTYDKEDYTENYTFDKEDRLNGIFDNKNEANSKFDKNDKRNSTCTKEVRTNMSFDKENEANTTFDKEDKFNCTFDKNDKSNSPFIKEDKTNMAFDKENGANTTFDKEDKVNTTFGKVDEANGTFDKHDKANSTFDKEDKTYTTIDKEEGTNTTFDKEDKAYITFDKSNGMFDKNGQSTFKNKEITDITYDKEDIANTTFDKADRTFDKKDEANTTFDNKDKADSTFDKEDKANSTFAKSGNTSESGEKANKNGEINDKILKVDSEMSPKCRNSAVKKRSGIKNDKTKSDKNISLDNISKDNSNDSILTSDTSKSSHISVTSDESQSENILNNTPLLVESSLEEENISKSSSSPTPCDVNTPIPPLKREGTFTKESPEVKVTSKNKKSVDKTPTRKKSLPSPGCTPFPHAKSLSKTKSILNITRSIEKSRRSSIAEMVPRATKVMFCSPSNNPLVVSQMNGKIIKSSLKGSYKSFIFEDNSCSSQPRVAGHKRSQTADRTSGAEPHAKRSRLAETLAAAAPSPRPTRLRTRTLSASAKCPDVSAAEKVDSTAKERVRTRLPNFAALHARQFARMESLDECQRRRAQRARLLLTPTGPVAVDRVSPKEIQAPKQSESIAVQKTETPTKGKPTPLTAGYSRFGFKLQADVSGNPFSFTASKARAVVAAEVRAGAAAVRAGAALKQQATMPSLAGTTRKQLARQAVMKEKSFTDKRDGNRLETRTVIKGVRTNRRFELQMKMRNINT